MSWKVEVSNTLRPCYIKIRNRQGNVVREKKGLFHRFIDNDKQFGEYSAVKAIVEFEDGRLYLANPQFVRFIDTEQVMSVFNWGEEETEENLGKDNEPKSKVNVETCYISAAEGFNKERKIVQKYYSCPKCGDRLYMHESTGRSLGKFGVATCEGCHCLLDWSECKEDETDD